MTAGEYLLFYTMWLAGGNGRERLEMSSPAWSLVTTLDMSVFLPSRRWPRIPSRPCAVLLLCTGCSYKRTLRGTGQNSPLEAQAETVIQHYRASSTTQGGPRACISQYWHLDQLRLCPGAILYTVWCWVEASSIVAPFPTFMIIKMPQDVT